MLAKPKSNSVLTHVVDSARRFVTFKVLGAGETTLDMRALHENVKERAELHGMVQRCSDGAAIARDPETGLPATPADKLARVKRLVEHYNSGTHEWSLNRVGDGTIQAGYLLQALCIMYPKLTPEQVRNWLGDMNRATQAELRKHPKVADIIDEIKRNEPVDEEGKQRADDILNGLSKMADAA